MKIMIKSKDHMSLASTPNSTALSLEFTSWLMNSGHKLTPAGRLGIYTCPITQPWAKALIDNLVKGAAEQVNSEKLSEMVRKTYKYNIPQMKIVNELIKIFKPKLPVTKKSKLKSKYAHIKQTQQWGFEFKNNKGLL